MNKAAGVLELNDLLEKAGVEAKGTMLMRHRPTEQQLRDVLPWLAAEQHDTYNAYQSQHGRVVEKALSGAKYLASFIGHEPRKALFVGLYAVEGHRQITAAQYARKPRTKALAELGCRGPEDGSSVLWFDLQLLPTLSHWKGRLVVEWTGIERSWWRWSDRNRMPVHAIHPESLLVRGMPPWHELSLTWLELQALPESWKQALSHWRGIYFIHDKAARMGYVGSAYGADNLMGRWMGYAATGHGGNKLLRARKAEDFSFSILQRLSPDMTADEVIAVENGWKERLHTRAPLGLNDN